MDRKVCLYTLGCKLNFSETSTIGKQFQSNGFSVVDIDDSADVYVINTCTVTENAEKECRQIIRRALRKNPKAFIVVTGCYAQLRPEEISFIDGVDLVLGSNEKFNLFDHAKNFEKSELACISVSPTDQLDYFGFASSTDSDSRTRAYLKIQDGCDYKCTFCTIPLARGKSRSMNPDDVIKEFVSLVKQNYKEIILTGVNVGDYGKAHNLNLHSLLTRMIQVEGDFRIRISSIEPNLLTDEILELTASSEKMCKHFHIPLQSGSAKILKLMQRRYTLDDYSQLITRAKNIFPELGIGVDVIVGFPGEGEEEFLETYNFLSALPISYLHVFTYSERPDTKAISMPNEVDVYERKKRNKLLRLLSEQKKNDFYLSQVGKHLKVIFETENDLGKMKGYSSNYIRVVEDYNKNFVNNITSVEVNKYDGVYCSGNILGNKFAFDSSLFAN
ncbi:MAG: tRNA (N(6)-L-threonylcarbamoyladenosine(37)-C(2))-methylthiotransferase MtaB [Chlorobiaceae bacterium]|nr:tRNA (N(6)-L-threonylcarbamoyladenosine(37)-C(2))-methylthiotransferase MtaB [Chlorobiaceae bacterium]MBA4309643.1 tRNA (N(6)-L-threonylcarbamoyladenosine(37)-C(2))-methylthiotransferase MtaB [Chlorobiaceae bacterium]